MKKVMLCLVLLVFTGIQNNVYPTEFFYCTNALGSTNSYFHDRAKAGADAGVWWDAVDILNNRAKLDQDNYLIVRNFGIMPSNHTGSVGLVKMHVEYSYPAEVDATDLMRFSYRIGATTEANAATIYGQRAGVQSFNYEGAVINNDYLRSIDFTASRTWTFSDLSQLHLLFDNDTNVADEYVCIDSVWLEVGSALQIKNVLPLPATAKIGIDSQNNGQFHIEIEASNYPIVIDSMDIWVQQNEFNVAIVCNTIKVWNDFNKNKRWDSSDQLLGTYNFNPAVGYGPANINIPLNYSVSGNKYLLITADCPDLVKNNKVDLELWLQSGCLNVTVPEVVDESLIVWDKKTLAQRAVDLIQPIITSFYPSTANVVSGDDFVLNALIKANKAGGNNIRWESMTGWPEPDYYASGGATGSYVSHTYDDVTLPPYLSLNKGGTGTVFSTIRAGHPGTLYFGAWGIGYDTVSLMTGEWTYFDSRASTLAQHGVETLTIVSGLTYNGWNISTDPVYQNQQKKPFLRVRLDATDQYADLIADTIKFNRTGTSTDTDVGTVYLYTDNNSDNSIAGETLLDSDSLSAGSVTFQFPLSFRTIAYGTYKDVLLCIDIPANATASNTVGFTMTDNTFATVFAPDKVKTANFPLSSSNRTINETAKLQIISTSLDPVTDIFPSSTQNLVVGFELKNTSLTSNAKTITIQTVAGSGTLDQESVGNGSAVKITTPTLTLGTLNANTSQWFYWDYAGDHSGQVRFSCYATGLDSTTDVPISAPAVWTSYAGVKGFITASGTDIAPASVGPGQGVVPMLKLTFDKDNDAADVTEKANFKSVTIDFVFGGACTVTDISKVGVYFDANGNGAVDPGESEIANSTSITDPLTINIPLGSNGEVTEGTSASYILTMDISGGATVGPSNTIVFDVPDGNILFHTPAAVNTHSTFSSSGPNIIQINGALTVQSLTPSLTLVEPGDDFTVTMTLQNSTAYVHPDENDVSSASYSSNSGSSDIYHYGFGTSSSVTLNSAPDNTPYGSSLDKDATVDFVWSYRAVSAGQLQFNAWGTGTDIYSGENIVSPPMSSAAVSIKNRLEVTGYNVGRTQIVPGDVSVPILRFDLTSKGVLDVLQLKYNVTAAFANIDNIKIYEDINGNGKLDSGTDVLLAASTVTASPVTLDLPPGTISLNNSTKKILTTVSMNAGATVNNTFSLSVPDNTFFGVTAGTYNDVKAFGGVTSTTCTIKKIGNFNVSGIVFRNLADTANLTSVESGNDFRVEMDITYVKIGGVSADFSTLNMLDFDSDFSGANELTETGLKIVTVNGATYSVKTEPANDPIASFACDAAAQQFVFICTALNAGDLKLSGWAVATPEARTSSLVSPTVTSSNTLVINNYVQCSSAVRTSGTVFQSNTNVPIMSFYTVLKNATASTFKITALKVKNIATPKDDNDVSAYKLYVDTDNSGTVNAGDVLVDTKTMSSSQLIFSIPAAYGTVSSASKSYLITADIDSEYGTPNNQIQLEVTDTTYVSAQSPNSVQNLNFPLRSNTCTIMDAVTLSVINFYTDPAPPTEVEVGSDITVNFEVKNSDAPGGTNFTLSGVTIESSDLDPDELGKNYGGTGAEVLLQSAPADGAITLGDPSNPPNSHNFVWTYRASKRGLVKFTGWGSGHDDINVRDTTTTERVSNSDVNLTLKKTLSIDLTDVSPAFVVQGQTNIPLLTVSFSHAAANFRVFTIEVTKNGTLPDNEITVVKLYHDTDGDGVIDAGEPVADSGTFSGGTLALSTGAYENVTAGTPRKFILAASIDPAATDAATLGIGITSLNSILIESDAYTYKSSPDSFAFNTVAREVKKKAVLTVTGFIASPTVLNAGNDIVVSMGIRNDGDVDVNALDYDSVETNPDELEKDYSASTGAVNFSSVTSHPWGPLTPGAIHTFEVTYNAANQGTVIFKGFAKGTDSVLGSALSTGTYSTSQVTINQNPAPVLSTSFVVNSYFSNDQTTFDLKVRASNGGANPAYNVEVYPDTSPSAGEMWQILVTGDTGSVSVYDSPSANQDVPGDDFREFSYIYAILGSGTVTFKATTSGSEVDDTANTVTSSLGQVSVTIQNHGAPSVTGFTVESATDGSLVGVIKDAANEVKVTLTVKNTGQSSLVFASAPTLTALGTSSLASPVIPSGTTIAGGASHAFIYYYTPTGALDTTVKFRVNASGNDQYSNNPYSTGNKDSNLANVLTNLTAPDQATFPGEVCRFVSGFKKGNYLPISSGYLYLIDPNTRATLKSYDYSASYNLRSSVAIQPFTATAPAFDQRYLFILKNNGSDDYYIKGNRNNNNTTYSEDFTKSLGTLSSIGSFTILNISSSGANSILYIGADNSMMFKGLPIKGSTTFSFETSAGPFGAGEQVGTPIASYGSVLGEFLMFYRNDVGNNRYCLTKADPVTASVDGTSPWMNGGQIKGEMAYDWQNDKYVVIDSAGRMVKFDGASIGSALKSVDILTLSGNTGNTFTYGPVLDDVNDRYYVVDDQGWLYTVAQGFTGSGDAALTYKRVMTTQIAFMPMVFKAEGYIVITDTTGKVRTIRLTDFNPYRKPYSLGAGSNVGPSYNPYVQKLLTGDTGGEFYQFSKP